MSAQSLAHGVGWMRSILFIHPQLISQPLVFHQQAFHQRAQPLVLFVTPQPLTLRWCLNFNPKFKILTANLNCYVITRSSRAARV